MVALSFSKRCGVVTLDQHICATACATRTVAVRIRRASETTLLLSRARRDMGGPRVRTPTFTTRHRRTATAILLVGVMNPCGPSSGCCVPWRVKLSPHPCDAAASAERFGPPHAALRYSHGATSSGGCAERVVWEENTGQILPASAAAQDAQASGSSAGASCTGRPPAIGRRTKAARGMVRTI